MPAAYSQNLQPPLPHSLLSGLTRLYTGEFYIEDPDGDRSLKVWMAWIRVRQLLLPKNGLRPLPRGFWKTIWMVIQPPPILCHRRLWVSLGLNLFVIRFCWLRTWKRTPRRPWLELWRTRHGISATITITSSADFQEINIVTFTTAFPLHSTVRKWPSLFA